MDKQDELFIVVNKSDKIIGYRTRFECHHNKKLIHRAIGIVIFNDKGQILVQKRSKNKDTSPGFYTLSSSGHVEKGESYKLAAQRELREELGIDTPVKLKKEEKFIYEDEIETEMNYLFSGKYNGSLYPNKDEVDKVKSVSVDELVKMRAELTSYAIENLEKLGLL